MAAAATATLTASERVSAGSFLFALDAGKGFPDALPGQFVHVATPAELTLRRPFSVAGVRRAGRFELLVKNRGRGTASLCSLKAGSQVHVIGPLGNGFSMPRPGETAVLACGGIGVAGLRLLAQALAAGSGRVVELVGARSGGDLLAAALPPATADGRVSLRVSTDDGSEGVRGTVCGLLSAALSGIRGDARVYCCGPRGMLAEAARIASGRAPCEVLIEEVMACGIGACRGCVVLTKRGYRAACSDGPVFDASEVVFEEGAGA